jgi:hypothetical protein
MELLDRKAPFGVVFGSSHIGFEQNGRLYNHRGELLRTQDVEKVKKVDSVIVTDADHSAQLFLSNVLSGGPLSRAELYKAAESSNQTWDAVKNAAAQMSIVKFKKSNTEYWKLQEA